MWRYARGAEIGSGHLRSGAPCQDRCGAMLEESVFVAAVADGAGSAARGGEGAELAVDAFLASAFDTARTGEPAAACEAGCAAARAAIEAVASAEAALRDFATTFLGFVATPVGAAAVQIGDGVICLRDAAADWVWFVWPQRGEYANTTRFLTDEDWATRRQLEALPSGTSGLLMMSDGLEPLALSYTEACVHRPFADGMIGPLEAMQGEGHAEGDRDLDCLDPKTWEATSKKARR